MQSMQLVFSRSWKLERVVLHLSSVLTPVCFLLFFSLLLSILRRSSFYGIRSLSRGRRRSSRACNSHAYLRCSLRGTFFLPVIVLLDIREGILQ